MIRELDPVLRSRLKMLLLHTNVSLLLSIRKQPSNGFVEVLLHANLLVFLDRGFIRLFHLLVFVLLEEFEKFSFDGVLDIVDGFVGAENALLTGKTLKRVENGESNVEILEASRVREYSLRKCQGVWVILFFVLEI